jgi:uncharacterized membrane protein YhaH (DUF805 family)/ribosomal protein L37E
VNRTRCGTVQSGTTVFASGGGLTGRALPKHVFCRGCGQAIHQTAPFCPHCGAPQQGMAAGGAPQQTIQGERLNYGFGGSIALSFNRYVQFSGRSPRAEYWYFALFTTLISIGASTVDAMWLHGSAIFAGIANLAFLLPSLSVFVRRLHDVDRSGWWFWLAFIPISGWVILLVWLVSSGTRGANRFAPNPLGA